MSHGNSCFPSLPRTCFLILFFINLLYWGSGPKCKETRSLMTDLILQVAMEKRGKEETIRERPRGEQSSMEMETTGVQNDFKDSQDYYNFNPCDMTHEGKIQLVKLRPRRHPSIDQMITCKFPFLTPIYTFRYRTRWILPKNHRSERQKNQWTRTKFDSQARGGRKRQARLLQCRQVNANSSSACAAERGNASEIVFEASPTDQNSPPFC